MVEPLRHRQTKGAANRYAQPKVTAPHSYSTGTGHPVCARSGLRLAAWRMRPIPLFAAIAVGPATRAERPARAKQRAKLERSNLQQFDGV